LPPAALNLQEPATRDSLTALSSDDVVASQARMLEANLELPESSAGSSKRVVSEEDQLTSTWAHRGITFGTMLLIAALLGKGVSEISSSGEALAGVAAFGFAYYLADFLTGIYHWSVDNYGDGSTPIVGAQIAAFQGHHQRPWTITEREFCNNLYKVFAPAAPFTLLCLLASPWTPSWLDVGLATATFLTCMSQQTHAWAHMTPSKLPHVVKKLQDAGILVSRKAHGAHHKAPFEGNYCIVSGVWNPLLDAGGDEKKSFFRNLENFVVAKTGVEPRCWHEPDYTWQEE